MDAGFETRLRAEDVSFEAADARLLRAVDDHRSLNAAADALGRSFSRSHRRIKALEEVFGPLVERQRGGIDGGGSELTDNAHELLARFERLRTAYAGTAETEKTVVLGTITERSSELAVVKTSVGSVRALASTPTDRVQVVLRADAITLHTPDAVPSVDGMSARNRLSGTISHIDYGESIARVACDVGLDTPIIALVTRETIEELGFQPDDPVVASFKATATRAIPTESDR
ncbi:TOBE domain-containing protein [Halocatena salina]|uniref:TOBE domain-containing protein n=1 Tax=Halocatena salina TaxID=2934340 RepID=A0A8U0A4T8_9EURY|nr:TOBE domain-containing protein [Halocatena salina]UPM42963.1 TOBE domain-containing protein [Halocatena salina]